VVQDPSEAFARSMPQAALDATDVDHVAVLDDMGPLIARLVAQPASAPIPPPSDLLTELASSSLGERPIAAVHTAGPHLEMPAPLACPQCGGPLTLVDGAETRVPRYRCHVGHAFSPRALLDALGDDLERALWVALRSLEERIALLELLARGQEEQDRPLAGRQYRERAEELRGSVHRIRDLLMSGLRGIDEPFQDSSD
jgi:two-component system chemotaxis response regulator CheB